LEIWLHCQDCFELFLRWPDFRVETIFGDLVELLEREELLLRARLADTLPDFDLPEVVLFFVVRLAGCFAKVLASKK